MKSFRKWLVCEHSKKQACHLSLQEEPRPPLIEATPSQLSLESQLGSIDQPIATNEKMDCLQVQLGNCRVLYQSFVLLVFDYDTTITLIKKTH